jgi:hypothetical protein
MQTWMAEKVIKITLFNILVFNNKSRIDRAGEVLLLTQVETPIFPSCTRDSGKRSRISETLLY